MSQVDEQQRDARAIAGAPPAGNTAVVRGLWAETIEALDDASLRYCVLRDPGEGVSGRREVDMLLDRRDLERFRRVVSGLGFVPLASWGYGGHRSYVTYEEGPGEWLKLDVVTSLRYGGRSFPLSSGAFAGCLERRRHSDGVWVPDAADAALGLLLHATLDKRAFKDEHRRALGRLRALVESDDAARANATRRFEAALGRALSWNEASEAIANADWDWFLVRRRRIAWRLFLGQPFGATWRWLAGECARWARPLLVASRRRGFSVALLGPDGAGKTTLARTLAGDIQLRARIVYMGSNVMASTVGLPSTRWIERRRNGRPADRKPGTPSLLGVIAYGNRLVEQAYRSLVALAWGLRGRFVVFDRHPYELHIAESPKGWGSRLRRRFLRMAAVRPNLVLILDAPPEMLHSRKGEHTVERLEKLRTRYRSLPVPRGDALVLDASAAQDETIRRGISMIWGRYRQHVLKAS